MLSPDVIVDGIRNLNPFIWTANQEKGEVWAGKQHGAQFKVIRSDGRVIFEEDGGGPDTISLILSGRGRGQERIRQVFVDVLGEPLPSIPGKRFRNSRVVCWIWNDKTTK